MSGKEVTNSSHSASSLEEKTVNNGVQFEEETTFSDPIPKEGLFASAGSVVDSDEDGEALIKNPFLDPDVAEHWTTVYEKSQYESRHAFDPAFTWTAEEEKKLVRRLDWHVCAWAVSILHITD